MKNLTCRRPDKDFAELICGHPLPCPHHTVVIEKDEEKERLCRLFKALGKAKDILGEENWREIRRLLAEGSMRTKEAEFLQNLRRKDVARSLGMTSGEYEEFVKNPHGWIK